MNDDFVGLQTYICTNCGAWFDGQEAIRYHKQQCDKKTDEAFANQAGVSRLEQLLDHLK